MKRLTLFAKGNVDVHDSLHSCRVGDRLLWNGLNEVVRKAYPDVNVRLRHETLTRTDALLAAPGSVPETVESRGLALGNYPAQSQFNQNIFTTPSDAIILSILPDVASGMLKHRREGFFFYTNDTSGWSAEDRDWLRTDFEKLPPLTVEDCMSNLTMIVERIREVKDVPILVYNLSSYIPGDAVHCYMGLDDTYTTRIRRFNLALVELSQDLGISIVDLDLIVARYGGEKLKLDAMHLTPEGYQRVAEEVIRILADLGLFDTDGSPS